MSGNGETNFAVALTKCFYCGDGLDIIINKKLTRKAAADVKAMDGKVVDLQPCQKCKDWMAVGVILLSIDVEMSGEGWETRESFPNPYRTGGFFVMSDDWITRVFPQEMAEVSLKNRWMYIEHAAAEKLGLFGEKEADDGETGQADV